MSEVIISLSEYVIKEIQEHLENIRHPKVEYQKDQFRMTNAVIDLVYDEAGYIQDLLNQNLEAR